MRATGTYIDNLALADQSLAELMEYLSATASAAKTTVIVCSDHSWRVPLWRSTALMDEGRRDGEPRPLRPASGPDDSLSRAAN